MEETRDVLLDAIQDALADSINVEDGMVRIKNEFKYKVYNLLLYYDPKFIKDILSDYDLDKYDRGDV